MENVVKLERAAPRADALPQAGPRRILVTGAEGFIGSVLTPLLLEQGYDVVGLDTGFYRAGLLYHDGKDRPASLSFDIVLNNLAGLAWTTGRITMTSDGMPWRPLVHVQDISGAVAAVLRADRDSIANQVLNVGDNDNNYRVREIAEAIGEAFPNCKIEFGSNSGDNRSYRVAFDKIKRVLPGFRCEWNAQRGAQQMRSLFEHIAMADRDFNAAPFTRLRQLQHLLATQQIDPDFYWRTNDFS